VASGDLAGNFTGTLLAAADFSGSINAMRISVCLGLLAAGCFGAGVRAENFDVSTNAVGHFAGGIMTPDNQIVTPAGQLLELPGMRPQALALSPDGRLLVTSGRTHELVVVNPATGRIVQRVPLPSGQAAAQAAVSAEILAPDGAAQLSFTGLTFSPDGARIYLSNVNGDIKVFGVARDGNVTPLYSLPLPDANAPRRQAEIPAGIAVSPDGKKLYVAGNLSNRLLELDARTGEVLHRWNVGFAPYAVVLCRNKIYVSNWGGRRPEANSLTGPAGLGTKVRVDARSIASEGSLTVIDTATTNAPKEIVIGRHACALALSPNQRWLVAACAGDDLLTVLDTRKDQVVEKICARQKPGDAFGAQPNALAFDWRGHRLFVGNGTQNAVAVFRFQPGESELLGLIPVGWFPGAIAYDARRGALYVANIKDLPRNPQAAKRGAVGQGFNTHQYTGSLSLVPVPNARKLADDTRTALANLRYPLLAQAKLPPRANRRPVPVPERVGEPSVFKHVIYIIKENRTYDQVLGDVPAGNGDADLCNFGRRVTPNEHKLVDDFVLLDNTYCSGILSADGHNWTDSGIATDYLEREFAGWPRSYPSGGDANSRDALAYSPAGFIWNDALEHGKTVANFGEFTSDSKRWRDPRRQGKITFLDSYRDFLSGSNAIVYACEPDIAFLQPYLMTNTIGWDLEVPDVWRAAQFKRSLKQFEANDNLPNLVIVWLPNDHTSGTSHGAPTPEAQVADNDLAVGQVVEAVSHSKFWKDTCIFAVEDDPQNGWDHVSGYRTTAYVVSPYTKRHAVIHTQYNQTSLLRTMELMLGLPPMNQMDATATPMFDCFTSTPDFTAYAAVPNEVPLDQMNPDPKKIKRAQLRKDAYVSARLPLDKPDQCNEDVLNRILWRATMGAKPYPEWAVKVVDDD
jgi:DNA-binding beta-propeller fold protein YncE